MCAPKSRVKHSRDNLFSRGVLHNTHNVDPGGVDAAVAQNVRQLGNVLFNAVKRPGEQLAQIVGKDLAGLHPPPLHRAFSYPTRYYSGLGSCHCG